jgi:hypothetical protein
MATVHHRRGSKAEDSGYASSLEGGGWVVFAGIMLVLVGFFNVINGIAAISNSDYLVHQLLFSNMNAWGWTFLIWGCIQILAGATLVSGSTWAIVVGIVTAFVNILAQLSWARTNPVWAVCAMVIDVLVIYGLVVHGPHRD